MILLVGTFVVSFAMVAFMLPHVLVLSLRKRLVDHIDPRKVHRCAASRLGGITFYPAILFSVRFCIVMASLFSSTSGVVSANETTTLEGLALLSLFLVGIYDDVIGVSYRKKFLVQIFAAGLIILSGTYFKSFYGFCGIYELPEYLGIALTLGFYIFVTNAINLIDGIDGLASSLSMMALAVYTYLMYDNGLIEESMMSIAALGALLPFWYSNVFGVKKGVSSKIFMGDTGALVIGAILGFSAVEVWNIPFDSESINSDYTLHATLAFTMLLVPCLDVVRIIIHRYRAKQPLFLPDKNHIHHKFMAIGCTPHKALLCIIVMNLLFLAMNLILSICVGFTYIVIIDIVVWTVMHILLSKRI